MTFYVDQEVSLFGDGKLTSSVNNEEFDPEELTKIVVEAVLDSLGCPFEAQLSVLLTDDENIRRVNMESRGIDNVTDVLSFPVLSFDVAADFSALEDNINNFDPDSGELILGDVIMSVDRLKEQAVSYGHSRKREYAFLLTHSLLHLLGYDHIKEEEALIMEKKQTEILNQIGVFR